MTAQLMPRLNEVIHWTFGLTDERTVLLRECKARIERLEATLLEISRESRDSRTRDVARREADEKA